MALEVISQILSPENATYINGVSAERRFSAAVIKNAYQGLVEKDGRGVSDKFVSEDDATSSAQVFVNRIVPIRMKPREQGASKNGASFSANEHYTQTETVGIEILQVLDDPIVIPRARQDMIKTDLLAEQTEIYSNRLKTILNGATAASKLLSAWTADEGDRNLAVISATDVTNKNVLNKFIEANSLLDEGDEKHGVDIFPEDTRVAVFKVSYRATLKTAGILVVGGANYAYDIAKGAGVSAGAEVRRADDGYIGDIDGVPCHIISNESLGHAADFCGFPTGEFKGDSFIGYISSSWANARGVSTSKQTKIVDAIAGQGVILQPYTKFGVASWYPKGNVILSGEELNLVGGLKGIFTGVTGITFKLKGAGSRLFPTLASGTNPITALSASALTVNNVVALDDWGTDHLKKVAYVVGTKPYTTVGDFIKAYNADSAEAGLITTLGSSQNFGASISDKDYVTVLGIADDGSVTLWNKQYLA